MGWRDARPLPVESDWRNAKPIAPEAPADGAPTFDLTPKGKTGALLDGLAQGGSLGFADELAGVRGVVDRYVPTDAESVIKAVSHPVDFVRNARETRPADLYRQIRDNARATSKEAETAHPLIHGGAEIAGSLAVPLPGGAAARGAGLGVKVLRGAGQAGAIGTALGAGKSEATDAEGVAKDALGTGLVSAPFGAAGGVASAAFGKLGNRFGGLAASADARAGSLAEAKALKIYDSAVGRLGGEAKAGVHTEDVLQKIITHPSSTPEQKAAAEALVGDPEQMRMLQRAFKNVIQAAPARIGKIQAAEKGLQEASDLNTPEAIAQAKAALLANPGEKVARSAMDRIKRHVIPSIATAGMGVLGATAGHVLGFPVEGAAAGLGLGKIAGISTRELLKNPAVQLGIGKLGSGLSSGAEGLADRTAPALSAEEVERLRRRFSGE